MGCIHVEWRCFLALESLSHYARLFCNFALYMQTQKLWFGKGSGIKELAIGTASNPPVDFELDAIMKKFPKPFRDKIWTALGIRR